MTKAFERVQANEAAGAVFEFFKPKPRGWRDLDAATRDYLEAGGLLLRAIPCEDQQGAKGELQPTAAARGRITSQDVRRIAGKFSILEGEKK